MAIKVNAPDWSIQRAATTRGVGAVVPGLPPAFVPDGAETEEFVAQPRPAVRGAGAVAGALDISIDLAPGEAAVLAVRHPSGALTFHAPRETTSRTRGGPAEVRFIVPIRATGPSDTPASRGIVSKAVKAIFVKVADRVVDAAVGFVLSKLALAFETTVWKRKGLKEGWLKVTKEGLASGRLVAGKPSSTERSLLLIHGTFSNAASAYRSLADSSFFEDVSPLYGDRIFAFDHFSISRTPEENVKMLLTELPDKNFTFDVITHSRGGLVLRNLVERSAAFGAMASRFTLGRAVLVAAPNEGTPLATPSRWEDTVGWVANLLELFPENPFTTGAEFVANGLVWIAKHASGDLPGLHSMDGDGDLIRELQSPPGPPADRYSVLAANYNPSGSVLQRLLDIGIDQFFNSANDLVVPSEGGWRVDPSGGAFIPGSRIGCFGPGGNISRADVTHVNFFSQPETVQFLVAALNDKAHKLAPLDPAERLPERRLIRAGAPGVSAPAVAAAGGRPAAAQRARMRGRAAGPALVEPEHRLSITVVNGDLTFEERALLVGHYRATLLTGTERVIDNLLDRAMSSSLERGVYPVEPGTNRIFINRRVQKGKFWQTPRPEAVIVAGLGQEGKLQSAHILHTVRQAVIAWAERVAERGGSTSTMSLATTLLASGGTGVTPGQSAQLVAQGVYEANEVIRRSARPQRLPEVRALRFIELYLSRATEAWEALKMLAHATPTRYTVTEPIVAGAGSLRRPLDSGYRGADYDFITAETRQDMNGNPLIAYALDTKRARTEVHAQATQGRLLRDLVATASSEANNDERISRSLYNLLVPIELESFLASSGETQIEVDKGTAGIPWELLNDTSPAAASRAPWAIRSKLLRKFRTETFRTRVNDADTDAAVLVIGEPQCPPDYPALPGALAEAKDVATLLKSDRGLEGDRVTGLFAGGDLSDAPDSRRVVDALFERSWRIVHVAGHGEPVSEKGDRGGVVLSNDTFLGASEIKAMRVVPELVFVNCCHLAAGSRRSLLREPKHGFYNRATFASGVAQALIEIGVRCVVAAGWAVDDAAASAFATTFYETLLSGQRFIDAVAVARAKAFEFDGNTWAAYQCYGDPDWRFKPQEEWTKASPHAREDEFDAIGSVEALGLALETMVVQSTFQGVDAAYQLERVRLLEQRWEKMGWSTSNDVAELFASAYAASGDLANAIRWYEAAIATTEGNVSFKAFEQVSNLRVRSALKNVSEAASELDRLVVSPPAQGARKRGTRAAGSRGRARQLADAKRHVRAATEKARATIRNEMKRLDQLSAFQETVERESMRGSAMKRLAVLETGAGRKEAARRALAAMARHYSRALDLARERKADNAFYPAINLIAAELALRGGTKQWKGLPASLFDEAWRDVEAKNQDSPDFWSLIAGPELQLYKAVAQGNLPSQATAIVRSLRDVHRRSQGGSEWASVVDTLRFALAPYLARATSARTKKAIRNVIDQVVTLAARAPGRS